ncbi:DUF192 domain-containing protein [Sphingomonas mollis]|uniref:DUF192 domain-containing protein n=1 Tax=Sphingomonas mollis TaxID=2795726 RepID=A0ABS0XKR4_9SPHN|nr:DUF192 domain-containing protein [Sphingomonas sp. BT553]MBJ6120617.1 DUF192 domain-containing protein [Sphingomonas sp. BT553]
MKAITAGLSVGLMLAGCGDSGMKDAATRIVPVTIVSGGTHHVFRAELAQTTAEQARGLMFRTDLPPDSAMLFAPYPPEGGPAREASFWMKNTPSALDIIFIRADGSIARIADNTIPFSEAPVASGEPIAAVLEVPGGRAAELGIGEGDMVRWPVSATAAPGPAR